MGSKNTVVRDDIEGLFLALDQIKSKIDIEKLPEKPYDISVSSGFLSSLSAYLMAKGVSPLQHYGCISGVFGIIQQLPVAMYRTNQQVEQNNSVISHVMRIEMPVKDLYILIRREWLDYRSALLDGLTDDFISTAEFKGYWE